MPSTQGQLSKYVAIFAGGTLFSRVLGLVRDMVWARYIPYASRDAFIFAFRLPNMLRDLVGEGALNAAFVPVFSDALEKKSQQRFRELVSAALSAMLILLSVLTVAGVLAVPILINGMTLLEPLTGGAPISPERLAFLTTLSRWTFPYLFFIGMAVFAMGALFTVQHYATSSWSPALLNVAFIACSLLFYDRLDEPAWALVLAVWIGGLAQMGVQFWAMKRETGVWKPNFQLDHPVVKRLFWLMAPVLFGQAASEVNKLVDSVFAILLGEGTVTVLFYANRLIQLPLSMFGFATAAAILPAASSAASRQNTDEIRAALMFGLRQTFFLVFPSLLGLIVLGEPIIRVLFQGAHFGPDTVARTASALTLYAFGLLSFSWVKVAVAGFYAVQDTRTPVIAASVSMLLNILLNCALVSPLGYQGLALATSISFTVNFVWLYILLCNRFGTLWSAAFAGGLLRMAIAGLMMAAVTYAAYARLYHEFPGDALTEQLIVAGAPLIIGAAAYFGFCAALGVPELSLTLQMLRRGRSQRGKKT